MAGQNKHCLSAALIRSSVLALGHDSRLMDDSGYVSHAIVMFVCYGYML
jgi:hypothetical protein